MGSGRQGPKKQNHPMPWVAALTWDVVAVTTSDLPLHASRERRWIHPFAKPSGQATDSSMPCHVCHGLRWPGRPPLHRGGRVRGMDVRRMPVDGADHSLFRVRKRLDAYPDRFPSDVSPAREGTGMGGPTVAPSGVCVPMPCHPMCLRLRLHRAGRPLCRLCRGIESDRRRWEGGREGGKEEARP